MSEVQAEKKTTSFFTKLTEVLQSRMASRLLPILFLVLLTVFFAVRTNGRFVNPAILRSVFEQALIVATVSTGASFIYASGNINLAMGATTVLTATVAAMIYNATGSFPLMLISSVVMGIVIMVISVLLSTLFNVRVMFVTIVMMTLLKAIQDSLIKGGILSVPYELTVFLDDINYSVIAFACFFVFAVFLFHFTAVGRSLKMLGTNAENAYQTGIERSKYLLYAFIVAGIGAGLAAIMALERAGSVSNATLASLNNDVLLAVVLGGMSIFGGTRSFAYTGVVGAMTVCVLNQGLIMLGVETTYVQAVRGIIFLLLIMTAQKRPKGLPAPEG